MSSWSEAPVVLRQWDQLVLQRPALGGKGKRLFEDYEQVERNYFRETGLFPIMHTVALRRDVYEANRWIAQSMMKALVESQRRTYEDLYEAAALKTMLPWLTSHVEQVKREMGEDFWPYGFEKNEAHLAHLPALLLRARSVQTAARAAGIACAGSAGVVQALKARGTRRG